MKDFKFTISTIILSVLSSLISPILQNTLYKEEKVKLLDYWYIFIIVILILFLFDFFRLLFDKDKCDLWRSRFYKFASKINQSNVNEKKYILSDLNARINLARRALDYSNSVLPKMVDIEWVDSEFKDSETYDLKEGQFVVKVSNKNSQEDNIINIVRAVTKRTSLVGIRYILDNNKDLETTIDEVITEKLIRLIKNKHILDKYYRDFLKICLDNNEQIRKYFEDIKNIDNLGMFFRVFLIELEFFSDRIVGQPFRPFLLGEIEYFLDYLKEITPEKTPEKVHLTFENRCFIN